jgi:hypothetical protein
MKIVLITTTINIPRVLALYRAHDPNVMFFVAADLNTPAEAFEFCAEELGECVYLTADQQNRMSYKVREHIPWNSITRRNIALLEAIKWGAELIVTIDDDNIPLGNPYEKAPHYFERWAGIFGWRDRHYGLQIGNKRGWFDPGNLLYPPVKHRGFPMSETATDIVTSVTNVRIGMAEGLILGDTDMDATTRMVSHSDSQAVTEIGRRGVVVDPRKTRTVCNTQNTAFIREIAPAMFCMPGLGRFDDIYASLITQRLMVELNLFVHFGPPFVYQQRNDHNLFTDLRAEIDGMERVKAFADALWRAPLPKASLVGNYRTLVEGFRNTGFLPDQSIDAAMAWADDCEAVL